MGNNRISMVQSMTQARHTPGPWTAEGSERSTATWVNAPAGHKPRRICTMEPCEQDWSNARLIAAAPDLLAALESAVTSLEQLVRLNRIPANNQGLRDARAAIAKARAE